MVKSVGADDLIHLTIREDGSGWGLYLDEKKIDYVGKQHITWSRRAFNQNAC